MHFQKEYSIYIQRIYWLSLLIQREKNCFPVTFCVYYQLHLGSPSYFLILLQFASFQGWGKDGMKEIAFDIYIIFTAQVIVSSCKFLAKFFKSL